jgi:hypothetical protein
MTFGHSIDDRQRKQLVTITNIHSSSNTHSAPVMEKYEYGFYENTNWNAIISVARAPPGRVSLLDDNMYIQQHKT